MGGVWLTFGSGVFLVDISERYILDLMIDTDTVAIAAATTIEPIKALQIP